MIHTVKANAFTQTINMVVATDKGSSMKVHTSTYTCTLIKEAGKGSISRAKRGGSLISSKVLLAAVCFGAGWVFSAMTGPRTDPTVYLQSKTELTTYTAVVSETGGAGNTNSTIFDTTASVAIAGNTTVFDAAARQAYKLALTGTAKNASRNEFVRKDWKRATNGGLKDTDRIMLADIYRTAESVFEYGLGESTYIADHVGVPRYAGIDSDAVWVTKARQHVSAHFRFYFADIGKTKAWGYPLQTLKKNILDYQLLPLITELEPFDVYMVDGRWRIPCMLLSFMHASARGANPRDTTVLLHDCLKLGAPGERLEYRAANNLLQMVRHSGERLCAYKRLPSTTDADLLALWKDKYAMIG